MRGKGSRTSMNRPASGSSRPWLGLAVTVAAALVIAAAAAPPAGAGQGDGGATPSVVVSPPVTPFVVDVDLRDLPSPPEWQPGMPIREVPRREFNPPEVVPPEPGPHGDPLSCGAGGGICRSGGWWSRTSSPWRRRQAQRNLDPGRCLGGESRVVCNRYLVSTSQHPESETGGSRCVVGGIGPA